MADAHTNAGTDWRIVRQNSVKLLHTVTHTRTRARRYYDRHTFLFCCTARKVDNKQSRIYILVRHILWCTQTLISSTVLLCDLAKLSPPRCSPFIHWRPQIEFVKQHLCLSVCEWEWLAGRVCGCEVAVHPGLTTEVNSAPRPRCSFFCRSITSCMFCLSAYVLVFLSKQQSLMDDRHP